MSQYPRGELCFKLHTAQTTTTTKTKNEKTLFRSINLLTNSKYECFIYNIVLIASIISIHTIIFYFACKKVNRGSNSMHLDRPTRFLNVSAYLNKRCTRVPALPYLLKIIILSIHLLRQVNVMLDFICMCSVELR